MAIFKNIAAVGGVTPGAGFFGGMPAAKAPVDSADVAVREMDRAFRLGIAAAVANNRNQQPAGKR